MSWVRLADRRLVYTRRFLPPSSFAAWTETQGRSLVAAVAAQRRFRLFGKLRAGRRDLWAMVRADAERGALADAIDLAVSSYLPTIAEIATLPVDLPRLSIALRRIVVVPRVVCNATALDYVVAAFDRAEFATMESGDALRGYLSMELLAAMDSAVSAAICGRNPIPASGEWTIVEADRQFSWWVPLSGDTAHDWRGHYVLYEAPSKKLSRAARRDLASRIAALNDHLPSLSRHQRNEIVTHARAKMRELTARALRRAG